MKYILSVFFLLVSYTSIYACFCPCFGEKSLCTLLNGDGFVNLVEARLIKTDSLLDGYTDSWQFELIEEYGSMPFSTSDTFWVAYDINDSCFEWFHHVSSASPFSLGDTLFFTTYDDQDNNIHILPPCNNAYFRKKDNQVTGNLVGTIYSESYDDFKAYIREGYLTDFDCLYCRCLKCGVASINAPTNLCVSIRIVEGSPGGKFKVLEKDDLKMEVVITDALYSWWDSKEDTLTIWGKQGDNDCRGVLDTFQVNSEYIINLRLISHKNRKSIDEKIGDYEFVGCGVSLLEIVDNRVIGPITENYNNLAYEEFKELFLKFPGSDLENCEQVFLNLETQIERITINPYPNPATTKVIFEFQQLGSLEPIIIYDINGQIVKKVELSGFENIVQIDIADLAANLYFWKIGNQSGKLFVKGF